MLKLRREEYIYAKRDQERSFKQIYEIHFVTGGKGVVIDDHIGIK